MKLSLEQTKLIGDKIGIDWNEVDLNEFHIGLDVETEHDDNSETDVVPDNNARLYNIGRIAWAHLKELPNYYTRLKKMESESKAGNLYSILKKSLRLENFDNTDPYDIGKDIHGQDKGQSIGTVRIGDFEKRVYQKDGDFFIFMGNHERKLSDYNHEWIERKKSFANKAWEFLQCSLNKFAYIPEDKRSEILKLLEEKNISTVGTRVLKNNNLKIPNLGTINYTETKRKRSPQSINGFLSRMKNEDENIITSYWKFIPQDKSLKSINKSNINSFVEELSNLVNGCKLEKNK